MITKSKSQTQKMATKLAKKIISEGIHKNARVLALIGDLGSGKTAFVQGFIKAFGIKTHVPSPTFVIFRRYPIKSSKLKVSTKGGSASGGKSFKFADAYHFDLYRIQKPKEIIDLDFKKIIKNPENIVLIEWPKAIMKYLPKDMICIEFNHGKRTNERVVNVKFKK